MHLRCGMVCCRHASCEHDVCSLYLEGHCYCWVVGQTREYVLSVTRYCRPCDSSRLLKSIVFINQRVCLNHPVVDHAETLQEIGVFKRYMTQKVAERSILQLETHHFNTICLSLGEDASFRKFTVDDASACPVMPLAHDQTNNPSVTMH